MHLAYGTVKTVPFRMQRKNDSSIRQIAQIQKQVLSYLRQAQDRQISQMGCISADPSSLRSLGMTTKNKPTAQSTCRGYQTNRSLAMSRSGLAGRGSEKAEPIAATLYVVCNGVTRYFFATWVGAPLLSRLGLKTGPLAVPSTSLRAGRAGARGSE
ncbi:MAG: hypothetical protein A3F68_03910 [Acidobacteria bacterium RIFCSPLOWO2_12_FULL_54_10]|nr:MAG: hypothetical protein A3F68_03910 [Acidobacteria bacterium RIFCSPLOWO2_12_FULL_54_10]